MEVGSPDTVSRLGPDLLRKVARCRLSVRKSWCYLRMCTIIVHVYYRKRYNKCRAFLNRKERIVVARL